MAENMDTENIEREQGAREGGERLEAGAYEIIRGRLEARGDELRKRLEGLNAARKKTFGSIDAELVGSQRITTENNCVPRDMIPVGEDFIFGYNIHLGLRREIEIADVFSVYGRDESGFRRKPTEMLEDERFIEDFKNLYKYYKSTTFIKFGMRGPHLFMVFQVGKGVNDIKTFKWACEEGGIRYLDNRSDHEFKFPPQHEFEWKRTTRDMHRPGVHPHVSIDDVVFVETVGGDLTVKVEDNTESGEGVYQEPVDNKDQTLDDATIYYANLGNLILLKILPYQEKQYRHIVFSRKVQKARRIDAIEHSCVLLPEGHGIIFPNGYYLQTGEYKEFESGLENMTFEKRVSSPNGEDTLYVFFNQKIGVYGLLSYNLIDQKLDNPIICNGFSIFDDGEIVYFKSTSEPQKYHAIQIWKTPFVGPDFVAHADTGSYLYNIGNRDIVHCMAACNSLLNLIRRDDTYAGLYVDINRMATDILDTYFWIGREEAMKISEPVEAIRETASSAIDEFEKVIAIREDTRQRLEAAGERLREIINDIRSSRFNEIHDFVRTLADLRAARGEVISLRDLRYVDLGRVDELEKTIIEESEKISRNCVEFLLGEDALVPYHERVEDARGRIGGVSTVVQARELEDEMIAAGSELEMLIDVVSNLKIEDATQRTSIIDNISAVYSVLNQARSALKNKIKDLASEEGAAEFGSQMKLLGQAVINYLDVSDSPEKCEEYLGKLMVQVEELEGRFADFEDFIIELTEKREEIYTVFESRKLALVEERNRRADALFRSAERVLKGIATRAAGLGEVSEINGYFASDIMIEKVRNTIDRLMELGDTVKADDIQSRLKTVREDAVRQLKDRKELFVGGGDAIRFGNHGFLVNSQALDLTMVMRESRMYLHLTGTKYTEEIVDEELLSTRPVWDQDLISENREVYRAEYLAYAMFEEARAETNGLRAEELVELGDEALVERVRQYMGPRYAEGYVKGVHDHDAARILRALFRLDAGIGLLRYHTRARALAICFWWQYADEERKKVVEAKLAGYGVMGRHFSIRRAEERYLEELAGMMGGFASATGLYDPDLAEEAAEYLFHALAAGEGHPVSPEAAEIYRAFASRLQKIRADREFGQALKAVEGDSLARIESVRDWVGGFLNFHDGELRSDFADEAIALIAAKAYDPKKVMEVSAEATIGDMAGSHQVIADGAYRLDFNAFMHKLGRFQRETVPLFEKMQARKKQIVERAAEDMRLDEFKPRVLTSFVRNKLIDSLYLPLIGDNLAKQIGAVGDDKRTDRMGLLLLISPPGYGKTTLMEYIANRLGITFVKINGPAIGDNVTSIDPEEAPNAAARAEMEKLNLSFEMGDNVMIYVDDIQHCNPEFLQKFISLCDAQRKIEGVWKGRARTYDLRGRKVAVVMAGNPYTESGEKFRVPDMLANRADTYNIGDIIGGHGEVFKLSYLENCMTSNPALSKVATRAPKDIHAIIRVAETGSQEGVEFEGSYSGEEMGEFVSVMKKLIRVRDIVLAVNRQYIESAGQSDDYRVEPPFKLQGSYRNMNRIAERVLPIMNDDELETLVLSDYENEAQTLTTGAEANLLKFKDLVGTISEDEAARWDDIKKTFKRNQLYRGVGGDDRAGQVVMQLGTFNESMVALRETIAGALAAERDRDGGRIEAMIADETLNRVAAMLAELAPKTARDDELPAGTLVGDEFLGRIEKALAALRPEPPPAETRLSDDTIEALERMVGRIRIDAPPAPAPAGPAHPGGPARSGHAPAAASSTPQIAVTPLIKALKDSDALIRADAAQALGELQSRRAVEPLIEALRDASEYVREAAAASLGQIGDHRAASGLAEATRDKVNVVCIKAIRSLRKLEGGEGIPFLISILQRDERDMFRGLAAEALGKSRDPSAIQPLINALNGDADIRVRCVAAKMLGFIGDRRAVDHLREAANSPNDKVRNAAGEALSKLV